MKNITYISAGAGSGKTTRIIAELVTAIQDGIRPSEIMMTTFTRAAAQEMRERAKSELLKQGLNDKANEMGAATIGTIHSVCLRFLQKYWYLVGLSPDIQEMDENDFNTYVDRSLFQHVSESNMQQFEQWRKVLDWKKNDGSATKPYTSYWREWLRQMANIVRYYHIDDIKQSLKNSVEEINAVFDRNAFNQDEYDRCKQEYIDAISGNGRLRKRLDYILNYDPIKEKGKISIAEGKDNYADMHNAWALAAGKAAFSDSKRQAAIAIVKKLFDILSQWRGEYQAYKLSHKMLDYNDMEVYFYQLLQQDDVKAELAHYRLVLVDEFQDCNPMQVDIFSRISDIVPRSIWVGDPKQAIYGFRGTDTTLVKEMSDKIVEGKDGCHRDTTETNYRSRHELVEHVNNIFLPIFREEPFGLSDKEIALTPGRSSELDSDYKQEWIIKGGRPVDISAIAYNIKQLVEEQKTYVEPKNQPKRLLQYGDIAILVRKNATISKLSKALRAFGIPFFAPQDNDKINQPIEVRLLMELAQYKYSWSYRPHLRADILHLLKNISTQDLLNDYFNHLSVHLDEAGKRCYDGKKEWMMDDELISRIEKIMQDCYAMNLYDTLTTLVDRLNLHDLVAMWGDAEIRRSNISRVLQLAKSFDRHCDILEIEKPTYADYAKYMDDAKAKDELNLDSPSVKIITMHKSKGLEWPVVIYYDLDNDFAEDDKVLYREFFGIREQRLPDHSYWLRVFPALSGSTLPQLYSEPYFKEAQQRVIADEQRLRYVALTRARDMLVTVRAEKDGPAYVHEPKTKNYLLIDIAQTQQNGSDLPYHINPSKSGITSTLMPSSATEVSRIHIPEQNEDVRMSSIGTCVHNIYAAYDASMDEHTATQMAQRIIDSVRLSQILNAKEVIVAIRSLYDHLTKQYGAPTSVGHEVPFSYVRNNGQLLRGEIDLLWHTSDGVVLVDYKNIQGDEANPEHYAAQMEAYREVIRAAGLHCEAIVLFYATLGKIIELR